MNILILTCFSIFLDKNLLCLKKNQQSQCKCSNTKLTLKQGHKNLIYTFYNAQMYSFKF